MSSNRLGKYLILLIVMFMVAGAFNLLFVERITSPPMFAMPEDKNRINNFGANANVWMVDDRLHLSFESKTLQVGDHGRFRRMNGKRMLATATDDYYLYSYVPSDGSNFIVNDIKLMRRSDGKIVHSEKYASDVFLDDENLYYITTREDMYQLTRYNLSTGIVDKVVPWVSSFTVVDNILLYTRGGSANDPYRGNEDFSPTLRYRDLLTGKDELLLTDVYTHGVARYIADSGYVYFNHGNSIYRFSLSNKVLEVFIDNPDILLINAYNGKLYLLYQEALDNRMTSYDIRRLDPSTGAETALLSSPIELRFLAPRITVLDDNVWVLSIGNELFQVYNNGEQYILQ